jgi:rhodanese-related sulfurtransferase
MEPQINTDFSAKKNLVFESQDGSLHYEGVNDIDPAELSKKTKDVILIDVRQPEEFHRELGGDLGHITGSTLVVLDTLSEALPQFPKDKTIVFVCRSGHRSAMACQLAAEMGYKSVYNLKGGMILWNDLHLPTEA